MRSLQDKVVVITGSSQGIGAAAARLFAAEGARVVICGRDKKRLQEVAASLNLSPGNVVMVTTDVRKAAGMTKIVKTAMDKFGQVDVFVNNAGVVVSKLTERMTEKEFDTIFDTNVKAVFLSFLELLPLMQKQGGGQIINISSMAGKAGMPGIAVYSSSKAALNVLTEGVANEVRNDKIKISVLSPASTDTNFSSNMSPNARKTPSRASKKLTVDEVAEAIIFLAKQNDNAWVSLAEIRPLQVKRR